MSAWTYGDWASQSGVPAQLARLNLHIAEVTLAIGPDVAADGKSRGNTPLTSMLSMLMQERTRLEGHAGNMRSGGVSRIRLGRATGSS